MTSASELFFGRRSRLCRAAAEQGFEISPPQRFSEHNLNHRHHPHHPHRIFNPKPHHRLDLDGSGPAAGVSQPRFRALDGEPIPVSLGGSQVNSENNNGAEASNRISSRPGFTRNGRLPGPVLLARDRLLRRLRSVSLSTNSRSHGAPSGITSEAHLSGGLDMTIDASGPIQPSQQLRFMEEPCKKPRGLSQLAVSCLKLVVFSGREKKGDCGICLESFAEGDKLICLPCDHRFHFTCLDPWIRTCGDCPYCRCAVLGPDAEALFEAGAFPKLFV